MLLQLPAVLSTGILHSPIRMMNNSGGSTPLDQCSAEGLQGAPGRQALPDRPTENLSAVKVHYRRHKETPLRRWHEGDIGHPNFLGSRRRRTSQQKFRSDGLVELAVGRAHFASFAGPALELGLAHQPFHAFVVGRMPVTP